MSAVFKMAAKTRHKKWAVKIQHCPISSKFDSGHFENGNQ
jgi:hypothetical protein